MRRLKDALVSAAVLAVLMVALAAMDNRVRDQFSQVARSTTQSGFGGFGDRLRDAGGSVVLAAWDQSMANAPMTIFVVIATILVVFMVRT